MPQIITQGVKYIKINKTDLNGVDMDSNLNSLQKLRLIYNDIGVVEYNVINITEYPDYYLYLVSANNNITSTDNEILDYSLSTNNLSTTSQLNNISPYGDVIINYGAVTQALGYFQTYAQGSQYGGGAFTVGKAANTRVSIICNYVVGFLSPGDFAFILLVSNIRGILASATIAQGNSVGFISHSLPNLYDNEVIRVELSPSAGGSGTLTNLTLSITPTTSAQSVSPTTTIIEPILPPNFYNSSCNAIINNVTDNQFSLNYQKVDYPYASIIAQNTQAIVNNTAVKAQVQDSNYNSLFYINPRYNGSRLIADKLNEYTLGDISYGKTAVIEQNQKYFGYFDWVGAFEPELKGATAAHVIYLIDEQGNAIPTREDFDKGRYYDLVYNFERDKEALINLKVPGEASSLKTMNGLKRVLYSGADITPIVHTDGGVNYSVGNIPISLVSIEFYTKGFDNTTYSGSVMTVGLKNLRDNSILIDQTFSSTNTGDKDTILTYQGSLQVGDIIQPFIIAPQGWYTNSNSQNSYWRLMLDSTDIVYSQDGTPGLFIDPYNGWTGSSSGSYIIKSSLIQDLNTTYNLPNLIFKEPALNIINNVSYPFWTSTGSNYIESSGSLLAFNNLAAINFGNSSQSNPTSFLQTSPNREQTGYDEVTTPFTIEIGDQFRFGYNENNVYTVVSQSFSFFGFLGITNRIFFDRDISTSGLTNYELNRFLIRRVIPDPALIIFDYTKPQGVGADGFIYPAAIPDELENNIDKIQEKLKRDNII